MPRTLRPSLRTPAMLSREPLGLLCEREGHRQGVGVAEGYAVLLIQLPRGWSRHRNSCPSMWPMGIFKI